MTQAKAQPTKGPWEARGRGGMSDGGSSMLHAHFRGDIMAGKQTIISSSSLLGVQGDTPEQAEANAHLLAAAPELLDSLKAWIESDFLISHDSTLCVGCGEPKTGPCASRCAMKAGRLAIAKAEGSA